MNRFVSCFFYSCISILLLGQISPAFATAFGEITSTVDWTTFIATTTSGNVTSSIQWTTDDDNNTNNVGRISIWDSQTTRETGPVIEWQELSSSGAETNASYDMLSNDEIMQAHSSVRSEYVTDGYVNTIADITRNLFFDPLDNTGEINISFDYSMLGEATTELVGDKISNLYNSDISLFVNLHYQDKNNNNEWVWHNIYTESIDIHNQYSVEGGQDETFDLFGTIATTFDMEPLLSDFMLAPEVKVGVEARARITATSKQTEPNPVPEPSTILLLGSGLLGLGWYGRKRKKA